MSSNSGAAAGGGLGGRLVLLVTIVATIALLVAALFVPAAVAVDRAVDAVSNGLFDIPALPEEIDASAENTVILASDGSQIAELHDVENRVLVPLDEVPQVTQDAVIATEDSAFYEHNGVNHRAMMRALVRNLEEREIAEGGSTITQQFVKIKLLTQARTVDRKIQEAVWAIDIERQMTKQEILEGYLNTAYFGRGMYGIGSAARFYFSKPVSDLTLAESALLAGLIRSPERNNPVRHPEEALARRDIVLRQMAAGGKISDTELEGALAEPLELQLYDDPGPTEPFFVDWVKRILYDPSVTLQEDAQAALGDDRDERQRMVFEGGLTIHTSLEPGRQDAAEDVLAGYLSDPVNSPMGSLVTIESATGAVRAMAVGPKEYGSCPGDEDVLDIDEVGFVETSDEEDDEGDEEDGPCVATKVNPVVHGAGGSGRQPGSAFKPVVLAAALEDGFDPGYTAETSSGQTIEGCGSPGDRYTVTNYADSGGGDMDMYRAIQLSNNVYHVKLAQEVGIEKVVEMTRRLGIEHSPNLDDFGSTSCSIALGSVDLFPVEFASLYATFANRGVRCAPFAISRIEDRNGKVIYENREDCERVLEQGIADQVSDLLTGPVGSGGTADFIRGQVERPVAGKTGTTNNWHDAWFAGYVPQYATVAWVGYERPAPLFGVWAAGRSYARVTGGSIPARMWGDYMQRALSGVPVEEFHTPPPSATVTVPNVVGMQESTAESTLEGRRLRATTSSVTHHAPAGQVVAQSPRSGSTVGAMSPIVLSVSDGRGRQPGTSGSGDEQVSGGSDGGGSSRDVSPDGTVPDVLGMSEGEARGRIAAAGLSASVARREVHTPQMDGRVIEQSPGPGRRLGRGGSVTITVGTHSPPGRSGGGGGGPGRS